MEQTMEEQIQQVNVRAPGFMETAVNGWFTILEAHFHQQNVTAPKIKETEGVLSLLLARGNQKKKRKQEVWLVLWRRTR